VLLAQSRTFARRIHVNREHHAGDSTAQAAQTTLHGGPNVAYIVEQQHERLPICRPPQASSRGSSRYPAGCNIRVGPLERTGNVIEAARLQGARARPRAYFRLDRLQKCGFAAAGRAPQQEVLTGEQTTRERPAQATDAEGLGIVLAHLYRITSTAQCA
jgi:hypothetical protein